MCGADGDGGRFDAIAAELCGFDEDARASQTSDSGGGSRCLFGQKCRRVRTGRLGLEITLGALGHRLPYSLGPLVVSTRRYFGLYYHIILIVVAVGGDADVAYASRGRDDAVDGLTNNCA